MYVHKHVSIIVCMYVCMVKLLLTRFGVRIESGRRSDERKIVGKIPMRYDNSLRNRS